MADQRSITLYQGDADPYTIVLRGLPVASVVETAIYLYENAATPNDIILRDPTINQYTPPTGGGGFKAFWAVGAQCA